MTSSNQAKIEAIAAPDLKVYVADGLLPDETMADMLNQFPDEMKFRQGSEEPFIYDETLSEMGENLSKAWNIPVDESYAKQGVMVKTVQEPAFFASREWKSTIASIIGVSNPDKLHNAEWKYKSHFKKSSGLWLHTDRDLYSRLPEVPDTDLRKKRNIEILIYATRDNWYEEYGGELYLFSNSGTIDDTRRECVDTYQYNRPLREMYHWPAGHIVRTSGVGGGWNSPEEAVDFRLEKKVQPLYGRVVILDYRNHYNVHALTPNLGYKRKLVEQWFYCEEEAESS